MLILLIVMIMINMQNKLYIVQFFVSPNDQFAFSPQAAIVQCQNYEFCRFHKLLKKIELPEKFKLPGKRGFKLTETREK